ncbi:hypothetical protein ABGB18_48920 [Nonomuraea sp. B12E4]|uniref:hypothetical protein n=1 Tax=Nonomuraea sp. B12E4 TaxID=3153564 RepID=UPI00325DF717
MDGDAAAQVLADLVERQWRAEARHRLLDDPEPIPVHRQLIAEGTVMSRPRLITAEAELTLTGRSADSAGWRGPMSALLMEVERVWCKARPSAGHAVNAA